MARELPMADFRVLLASGEDEDEGLEEVFFDLPLLRVGVRWKRRDLFPPAFKARDRRRIEEGVLVAELLGAQPPPPWIPGEVPESPQQRLCRGRHRDEV